MKRQKKIGKTKIESEAGVWAATFLSELIEKMGITAEVDYESKNARENVINLVVKSVKEEDLSEEEDLPYVR